MSPKRRGAQKKVTVTSKVAGRKATTTKKPRATTDKRGSMPATEKSQLEAMKSSINGLENTMVLLQEQLNSTALQSKPPKMADAQIQVAPAMVDHSGDICPLQLTVKGMQAAIRDLEERLQAQEDKNKALASTVEQLQSQTIPVRQYEYSLDPTSSKAAKQGSSRDMKDSKPSPLKVELQTTEATLPHTPEVVLRGTSNVTPSKADRNKHIEERASPQNDRGTGPEPTISHTEVDTISTPAATPLGINTGNRFQVLQESAEKSAETRPAETTTATSTVGNYGTHTTGSGAQNVSATDTDILVICDSTGRSLLGRRMFRDKSVYIKKLQHGKNTTDAQDYITKCRLIAERIVFCVGTNDLSTKDVPIVRKDLCDLLDLTAKKFPQATILFSQVLPRVGNGDFNNKARQLNATFKVICQGRSGVQFIDQTEIWRMNTRPQYFLQDGLHLSRRGTGALVRALKDAMDPSRPTTVPTGHNSQQPRQRSTAQGQARQSTSGGHPYTTSTWRRPWETTVGGRHYHNPSNRRIQQRTWHNSHMPVKQDQKPNLEIHQKDNGIGQWHHQDQHTTRQQSAASQSNSDRMHPQQTGPPPTQQHNHGWDYPEAPRQRTQAPDPYPNPSLIEALASVLKNYMPVH